MHRESTINLTYLFTLIFYIILRFIVYGTQYFIVTLTTKITSAQVASNDYIVQTGKQILSYYQGVNSALPWVNVLFAIVIGGIFAYLARGASKRKAREMVVRFNSFSIAANAVMSASVYFLTHGAANVLTLTLIGVIDEGVLLAGTSIGAFLGYEYLSRKELEKYK